MEYKIGDRIELISEMDRHWSLHLGSKGTIVALKTPSSFVIKWDDFEGKGHDGGIKEETNSCLYVDKKKFKLSNSSKFKAGDFIKGIDSKKYTKTDINMTKAEVLEVYDKHQSTGRGEGDIRIRILEHSNKSYIGDSWIVESKYFDLIPTNAQFKIGDRVEALNESGYVDLIEIGYKGVIIEIFGSYCEVEFDVVKTSSKKKWAMKYNSLKLESQFKIGDLVKGIAPKNIYGDTNHEMTLAKVTRITSNNIEIEILDHKNKDRLEGIKNKTCWVEAKYFILTKPEVEQEPPTKEMEELELVEVDNYNEEVSMSWIDDGELRDYEIFDYYNSGTDDFFDDQEFGCQDVIFESSTVTEDRRFFVFGSEIERLMDRKVLCYDADDDYYCIMDKIGNEYQESVFGPDLPKGISAEYMHYIDIPCKNAPEIARTSVEWIVRVNYSQFIELWNSDVIYSERDRRNMIIAENADDVYDFLEGLDCTIQNDSFESGDIVYGTFRGVDIDDATVEEVWGDGTMEISFGGEVHAVVQKFFKKRMNTRYKSGDPTFEVGDVVVALENAPYSITGSNMRCAEIVSVPNKSKIKIKVLKHEVECYVGTIHDVESRYFKVVQPTKAKDTEGLEVSMTITKSRQTHKEVKGNDCMNMKKIFGAEIGKVSSDVFKLSPLGIAIRNAEGSYVVYDAKNDTLTDVNDIVFDNKFMYAMPAMEIVAGDLIYNNGAPVYVKDKVKGKGNKFTVINVATATEQVIQPPKSIFGFTGFVKIISLIDANVGQTNPLMLAVMAGEGKMEDMLPMMMLTQNQGSATAMDPMMMMAFMGDSKMEDMMIPMMMMQGQKGTMDMNAMLPFLMMSDKGSKMDKMIPIMMMMNGGMFGPKPAIAE